MICISTLIGINLRSDNLPDYQKGEIKAEYLLFYDQKDPKHGLEITRILSNNFLIYNTLIPVSIFVTFIICKILQTIYLQQFSPEYRKDKNDNIKCFSTGLIDQLGLVKYIFSDKTGTLTKNEMVFKGCSINRELFDESVNNNDSMATDTYIAQNMFNIPPQSFFGTSPSKKNLSFNDSTKGWTNQSKLTSSKVADSFPQNNLFKFLPNNNISTSFNIGGIPFSNKYEPFEQFFINIIVNHDVLIEQNEYSEIYFQGASPDEITLVTAAYEFGFCFKSKEKGIITIEIYDHNQINMKREKYFKILQKFDFTSERQCSSIVVEDLLTKKITLYIKGSDNKIFKSLDNYSKHNILPKTKEHLDNFAKQGLRTLCFGFKNITKEEYSYWDNKYKEAKHKTLENKLFQKDLDLLIKYLESNVTLLGVSALEDKLQDEVEKDIKKFIDAGINFWMITGDKMDTAESIGYSCGIFSQDCEVYKIKDTNNVNNVINAMKEIKDKIAVIDDELAKIKEAQDKEMNEKKINAKNSKKKVNRYNSIDMPNVTNIKQQMEIIKFISNNNKNSKANEYKENSKNELNNKESGETYQENKIIINDNNEIKISRKKEDNQIDKNSLNNKNNNNSFDARMLQLKDDLNKLEENSQNSGNNKKIFKYVAINIDNVSNYAENSLIQNKVKKIAESANSSEIFAEEETEKNRFDNNSKYKPDEDDDTNGNKWIECLTLSVIEELELKDDVDVNLIIMLHDKDLKSTSSETFKTIRDQDPLQIRKDDKGRKTVQFNQKEGHMKRSLIVFNHPNHFYRQLTIRNSDKVTASKIFEDVKKGTVYSLNEQRIKDISQQIATFKEGENLASIKSKCEEIKADAKEDIIDIKNKLMALLDDCPNGKTLIEVNEKINEFIRYYSSLIYGTNEMN